MRSPDRARDDRGAAGAGGAVIRRLSLLRCRICCSRASARVSRLPTFAGAEALWPYRRWRPRAPSQPRPCRARGSRSSPQDLRSAAGGGPLRLEAIDRSPLTAEIGRAAVARVVVTGPARRTQYAIRLPARVERFAGRDVREPVLLQLPVGRSPPQGAVLRLPVFVTEPRTSETASTRERGSGRHGVHVVLKGRAPEIVGRRGGLGGVADRLRSAIGTALASGVSGERRAVLLGIVLGEDEGLDRPLRDAFRASGLYHLLAVSGQNVALVAGGVLARGVAARDPAHGGPGGCPRGHRRVRARSRRAALRRAGRRRGRARIARLDLCSGARPLVVPAARRARAARLEPVQPARPRLPALVRGGGRDLRRSCLA